MQENGFQDYYEILQLSPNADSETIDRVYRILIKRYHPDNQSSANPKKFEEVLEAYRVLSNDEKRAAYDVRYDENRGAVFSIFKEASGEEGFQEDRRIFKAILSLLYTSRRRNPNRSGMGIVQIEKLLGCPAEHLEFHFWYLKEKGWIERQETGLLAITTQGIDEVVQSKMLFRRDRLLASGHDEDAPEEDREVVLLNAKT